MSKMASSWRDPGFFGKIPARGDFVQRGLRSTFVTAWDAWMSAAVAASKATLGPTWLDAWLEAPIWNFHLRPGICGPDAALGVFMPSVDSVGRHFPLTLARLSAAAALPAEAAAWLACMEAAGIAALEETLDPDRISDRLRCDVEAVDPLPDLPPAACVWWTIGAPRVSATIFATDMLPDPSGFARMLDVGPTCAEAIC